MKNKKSSLETFSKIIEEQEKYSLMTRIAARYVLEGHTLADLMDGKPRIKYQATFHQLFEKVREIDIGIIKLNDDLIRLAKAL